MRIIAGRWAAIAPLAALGLALSGGAGCARTGEQAPPPAAPPAATASAKPAPSPSAPAPAPPVPASSAPAAPSPLAFDTYGGYFVSNKFEPEAETSLVVIQDQQAFDKVFGAAFVMRDKSHRLPPGAFDSCIVLAAIHRGKAVWEYAVQDVRAAGGVVTVRYTATAKPSESAEFACPLILSVPKGPYAAVQFVENDKPLKKVEIAPPAPR